MPFIEVAVRRVRAHCPRRGLFDSASTIAAVRAVAGRLYAIRLTDESCPDAVLEMFVELIDPLPMGDDEVFPTPGATVTSALQMGC